MRRTPAATISEDGLSRTCTVCKDTKLLEFFVRDPKSRTGTGAHCRVCAYKKTKEWVKKNSEKVKQYHIEYEAQNGDELKAYRRNWGLQKRHGITHDWYLATLESQGGGCAICGGPANSKDGFFHIDHDHDTGQIRGILCHFCNTGLGSLKDSVNVLAKAIVYLQKHGKHQ